MTADYELTLNDYLHILRRRAYYIAGIFTALLTITAIVAVAIPPVYESTGTILIESQEVPTDLVQAAITTFADERIELIKQRVMNRDNLMRIIDKYHLYEDDRRNLSPSELIDEMRNNVAIELIRADVQTRTKSKATIAFKVSFTYRRPEVVYRVSNELVTLFLDENIKSRTERATDTTAFLTQESERLKAELEKIENEVANYKQQNANALPEHTDLRMASMQRTESQLNELERDYKDTQERLRYLDVELASAKAGIGSRPSQATAPTPASELERLQAEYAKLSATYSENYPDVRSVKRKIEALEKAQAAASANQPAARVEKKSTSENVAVDLMVAKVQAQIDAANDRLLSLDQQRKTLRARLATLEGEVVRTPQVEHALSVLMRDYETAKKKYEEVRFKQDSAKISENLEQGNKGERFSLIDPPVMPDKPVKPDRIKILLLGFLLSIGASGGGVFMLEMMGKRIWGVDALAVAIRHHPLAVIPYITTHDEVVRKKRRLKTLALVLSGALIMLIILTHFLYMPLNVLLFKIAARFG